MRLICLIVCSLFITCSVVKADPVTIPNTLSNGTVADADDVNANFTALADASNQNDTRIGLLEGGEFITPYISLSNNGVGTGNTIFGVGAGSSIVTGGDTNSAFGTNALYSNTTGHKNTASGVFALFFNSTGYANTASGNWALFSNQTGYGNTAIGYGADVTFDYLNNTTAIGFEAKVTASDMVRIGNSSVLVIEGNVPFSSPSDKRLKENIQTTALGLAFVNDLNPVQYHRINNQSPDIEMGIVAQELKEVLEKHNASSSGMIHQVGDSNMSVRYNDLFAPLIKSVQELSTENAAQIAENIIQANRIETLEAEVAEIAILKAELAEIKALIIGSSNN